MMKWLLIIVLVLPVSVFAGEYCAEDYQGICRDGCLEDETGVAGGFIDCGENQVCCVKGTGPGKTDSGAPGDNSGPRFQITEGSEGSTPFLVFK